MCRFLTTMLQTPEHFCQNFHSGLPDGCVCSTTHGNASIEFVIEAFTEYPSLLCLCFRKTEVDIILGLLMTNI